MDGWRSTRLLSGKTEMREWAVRGDGLAMALSTNRLRAGEAEMTEFSEIVNRVEPFRIPT